MPAAADVRRLLLAHQLPLTNSAITVRRPAWQAVGGHDEGLELHDDRDFLLRLTVAHEISLGQAVDVIKYRGPGSVSHRAVGYIAGLDALVARYPDYYLKEYAAIFRYLIARGIMSSLSRGRLVSAFRELRALRNAQHLPHDFLRSASHYWSGRRERWSVGASATCHEAELADAKPSLERIGD